MGKKVKCSFFKCPNEMDVEKREVRVIRIRNWHTTDPYTGERHLHYGGHRFICAFHDKYIKRKKLPPTIALIYGPKRGKKGVKKHKKGPKTGKKGQNLVKNGKRAKNILSDKGRSDQST